MKEGDISQSKAEDILTDKPINPFQHLNIILNPDGSVCRLLTSIPVVPNSDPSSGDPVLSKDSIINPTTNTFVRVYLPLKSTTAEPPRRLPIVFYFYGCSWVQFSADNPPLHLERQRTAIAISSIIILVNYRLSPEVRLPGQYDDAMDALLWVKKQAEDDQNGDPWLREHGDFSRCFLSGSGNGGNIAFHCAVGTVDVDLGPLRIAGVIMNQPLFGGQMRTRSELQFARDPIVPLPVLDLVWKLALPEGVDRDHYYCNPMSAGPHLAKIPFLPRCLVNGFGMDPTVDRQRDFVQMLISMGVNVEAHFEDVGFHRIEIVDPRRHDALITLYKEFISVPNLGYNIEN
ncbi:unnamed protein product [Linum trigynum]|uniref:Alpha/beta hydrolase fold-3 domain-containing protein n=1 Tax=Linum trigynum TaxID=586398 RepID=A0AAV2DAT7_9ROSI